MANNEAMTAGVSGRYASALLETAREGNQLDAVERDLTAIDDLMRDSEDLRRLVRSPVFSADDQVRAIEAVLTKLGAQPLTMNFFKLLVRNRRLFAAPEMIRAFKALAAAARGEVQAKVATAVPLNDAQLNALRDVLRRSVGKDVTLETQVDPSLLGGLVVRIGSRMIDSSLKTKIESLKTRMKEVQ